jgi:hypothetical protein
MQVARDRNAVLLAVPPQRRDGPEAERAAVETRRPTHEVEQAARVVLRQSVLDRIEQEVFDT